MIGRLLTRSIFVRRIFPTLLHTLPLKPKPLNASNLLFVASFPLFSRENSKDTMDNFDLHLKEACEKGEKAINELMNTLKNHLIETSKEYKKCLKKQIEVIDAATKAGVNSTKWDELPEFRTQAIDLSQQLQNYISTINTLGELAKNETLQYITQQKKQFEIITKKHKELEKVIHNQMEEIKKLEDKVLEKNRESIQKATK